jgi:pimeloyl-ACP methyl ester carboxylesterase
VAGVQDQLAAGDIAGGTRRFFEDVVLAPGSWEKSASRSGSRGNAQTFVDLREDPEWATLDVAALSRLARPILVTAGEASPPWLGRTPFAVAERAGIRTRRLRDAGHSPHLTHPEALVEAIADFARLAGASEDAKTAR